MMTLVSLAKDYKILVISNMGAAGELLLQIMLTGICAL